MDPVRLGKVISKRLRLQPPEVGETPAAAWPADYAVKPGVCVSVTDED